VDPEHRALVDRLGLRLVALGMDKHAAKLRDYRRGAGDWTRAHVEQLAAVLRVPPLQDVFPVKSRMSGCGCPTPQPFTKMTVRGASLHTCGRCRATWVEID